MVEATPTSAAGEGEDVGHAQSGTRMIAGRWLVAAIIGAPVVLALIFLLVVVPSPENGDRAMALLLWLATLASIALFVGFLVWLASKVRELEARVAALEQR